MDEESLDVIHRSGRPGKEWIRSGCSVFFLAGILLIAFGKVSWLGPLIGIGFIAMMVAGARLMQLAPADGSRRSTFKVSLLMANVPEKRHGAGMPIPMGIAMAPFRWYIQTLGGDSKWIRAAKDGESREPWLIEKLNSSESHDRWRSVVALGRMGSERSAPGLRARLHDSNASVREAAAIALRNFPSDETTEVLEGVCRSTDDDVQWLAAIGSLYELGETPEVDAARVTRALNIVDQGDQLDRIRAGSLIASLPAEAIEDHLERVIASGGAGVIDVFQGLGRQDSPAARQLLLAGLQSGKEDVERSALLAVGNCPDPYFRDALLDLEKRAKGFDRLMAREKLKEMDKAALV